MFSHPHATLPTRSRRLRPGVACALVLGLLGLACSGKGPDQAGKDAPTPDQAPSLGYSVESQPFSPTLAHLFDQGRIVVLPDAGSAACPYPKGTQDYAFSAVDRYGKIYHFDPKARWWMAPGPTFEIPLPKGGWDVAWNPTAGALEVLVTAPWEVGTGDQFQVYRWTPEQWQRTQGAGPPARTAACRAFLAGSSQWLALGGRLEEQPVNEGWLLDAKGWTPWGEGAKPGAPDLSRVAGLIDATTSGTLGVVSGDGQCRMLRDGAWLAWGRVDPHNLFFARYLPGLGKALFVWNNGLGEDKVLLRDLQPTDADVTGQRTDLLQTGTVKVNSEDEGQWRGWGRLASGGATSDPKFESGLNGAGKTAFQISGEYGEGAFTASDVQMVELPPKLATLAASGAAWVDALGGLVVPSRDGLGLNVRREKFFPSRADDRPTTSGALVDVVERSFRLWVFKGDLIAWVKPPFEVHPDIGYPNEYRTPSGQRRTLSWAFPEPGLLHYEYQEIGGQKHQWIHSPLLTLRDLPGIDWTPNADLVLLDPVVAGDPAEVVVVGWCGKLGEYIHYDQKVNVPGQEAYTSVPERGFMARINALAPQQWKVSELPISFCEGARLIVIPSTGQMVLIGGKIAVPALVNGRREFFRYSNRLVWRWDGEQWMRIEPAGDRPKMKVTSNVAYYPPSGGLMALTPIALYSFQVDRWRQLWRREKGEDMDWPEEVGLYVHPLTNLTVGAWFLPKPLFAVWEGKDWRRVSLVVRQQGTEVERWKASAMQVEMRPGNAALLRGQRVGGELPDKDSDVLPALAPDAFIAIDSDRLAHIRMDAPRDRDKDRFLGASWLQFAPMTQALPPLSALTPETTPVLTATPTPPPAADRPATASQPIAAADRPATSTQPAAIADQPTTPVQSAVQTGLDIGAPSQGPAKLHKAAPPLKRVLKSLPSDGDQQKKSKTRRAAKPRDEDDQ